MTNSRASAVAIKLYDSGTLTTDTSNTYTPSSNLTKLKYRYFIFRISGLVAGALELQMVIDNITTSNYQGMGGTIAATGVRTALAESAQAACPLANTTTLDSANRQFIIFGEIHWMDANLDSLVIKAWTHQTSTALAQEVTIDFFDSLVTDSEIDKIEIKVSTSTWTGSWQLYGVPV